MVLKYLFLYKLGKDIGIKHFDQRTELFRSRFGVSPHPGPGKSVQQFSRSDFERGGHISGFVLLQRGESQAYAVCSKSLYLSAASVSMTLESLTLAANPRHW